jgi:hypothetical protein
VNLLIRDGRAELGEETLSEIPWNTHTATRVGNFWAQSDGILDL